MPEDYIKTIKDAQGLVSKFARNNGWEDKPNVDKFDHLHEELIEMSKHLRYLSEEERAKVILEKKEVFIDGVGDLYFGLCRLANQLGVDMEQAFNQVQEAIHKKYEKKPENKFYTP
jgi:NTP pyrophosphatase (non-canonical NTP hydrolase)